MKKSAVSHLYGEEYRILNHAKIISTQHADLQNQLSKDFLALTKAYEKLLNNTIKLTTISDSQQLNLLAVQEKLITSNKELEILSVTDRLTSLYNRAKFDELMNIEIQKSIRVNLPLSLMIIDIDFFKRINDTYGHVLGDQLS